MAQSNFQCTLPTTKVLDSLADLEQLHIAMATMDYSNILNAPEGTIAARMSDDDLGLVFMRLVNGQYVNVPVYEAATAFFASTAGDAEVAESAARASYASNATTAATTQGIAEDAVMLIRWGGTGGKTAAEARANLGIISTKELLDELEFYRQKLFAEIDDADLSGDAPRIRMGSVKVVDYGQPAEVSNSGRERNAVLDFVLPEGKPGKCPEIRLGEVIELEVGESPSITARSLDGAFVLDFALPAKGQPTRQAYVLKVPVIDGPENVLSGGKLALEVTCESCLVNCSVEWFRLAIPCMDIELVEVATDGKAWFEIEAPASTPDDGQLEVLVYALDELGNHSPVAKKMITVIEDTGSE